MTTLTLIRHGQASFGSDDYDRLSPLGEWQSQALGEHFERTRPRITGTFSGRMRRQRQTGRLALSVYSAPQVDVDGAFDEYATQEVFAHHLPPLLDRDLELREILARDRYAAGRDRALSERVFFPVLDAWVADADRSHGFESFAAFRARVRDGLRRLATADGPDAHHVVFTSSGVITVAMLEALGLPQDAFARIGWQIHNASVSRFTVHDGRLSLAQFNATAHLEERGRSDALTWL